MAADAKRMSQDPSSPESPSPLSESTSDLESSPLLAGSVPKARGARRGFLDLLLILILAGLAGADYLLYRMQQDQQLAVTARSNEMERRIQALETDQKQKQQTRQALATLNTEVQSLRRQVGEALRGQQEALQQLRREMQAAGRTAPGERGLIRNAPPGSPEAGGSEGAAETAPGGASPPSKGPEDTYVDFVESAGSQVWHWIKEGASQLWATVKGWFGA